MSGDISERLHEGKLIELGLHKILMLHIQM